jgi:hypothetical protein
MDWALVLGSMGALAVIYGVILFVAGLLRAVEDDGEQSQHRRWGDKTLDEHLAGALGWTDLQRVGQGPDEHLEGRNPDTGRLERVPTADEMVRGDRQRRRT